MSINTPEPRLPLEPEEYPLYKPPSRIGCSGLSIVALIAVAVFAVLFWRIAPPIVQGITSFNPSALLSGDQPTSATTPGTGAMSTQTVEASVFTPVPATPTIPRQCVKVAGPNGNGTALLAQPKLDAKKIIPAGKGGVQDGATFQVIGRDEVSGKDSAGNDIVWMHVQLLPPDKRSGYMLGKYLQPTSCP